MADRIVVMHDGIIEQIGTPLELFDRPGNLFVAQFIGSPSMNVFEGTLSGGAVEALGARWPVPAGVRRQRGPGGALRHPADRPGAGRQRHPGAGGGGRAHRRRDRAAAAMSAAQQLVLVMHGRTAGPARRHRVSWRVDADKAHVFDGASRRTPGVKPWPVPARGRDGRQRLRQEHGRPCTRARRWACTSSKVTTCTRRRNVALMAAGTPLTDDDRARLAAALAERAGRSGRARAGCGGLVLGAQAQLPRPAAQRRTRRCVWSSCTAAVRCWPTPGHAHAATTCRRRCSTASCRRWNRRRPTSAAVTLDIGAPPEAAGRRGTARTGGRRPMITADTFRLDGRIALVTGSSGGIGLALARGLGAGRRPRGAERPRRDQARRRGAAAAQRRAAGRGQCLRRRRRRCGGRCRGPHRSRGRSDRHPGQQRRHHAPRALPRVAAGRLASRAAHQHRQRLRRRPGRGAAHGGARPRPHHQHLLGAERAGPPGHCRPTPRARAR